jgi:TonB-dependent SusC/RagA subfamily outer membrane receptor
LLVFLLDAGAAAQTGTVVGTVTDAQSGAPLGAADVVVLERNFSGLTRPEGDFRLVGIPAGSYTVRAQRVGYGPLELSTTVPAGGTVTVDFALDARAFDLDEIVVTSAGRGARQREVGHSSVRLRVEDASPRRVTVSEFLQGAAAGVEVTGGSAEAGQGKQIRLRGNRSLTLSNQPLVYVDGVRMMDGAFPSEMSGVAALSGFSAAGAKVTTSPLDMISMGDIERIEILKGPAATALFGTGAGSGVVQIFTRAGRPGGPHWTAEIVQGTGWVRRFGAHGIDYFNVENFLRDAWWGGGYEGGALSKECVTDDEAWRNVNESAEGACSWPGAQWYQTYRLSAGGGSEKLTYFASSEYQNDTYALPLDRLERYAARVNVGATLSPRLGLQANVAITNLWTRNTASGSNTQGLLLTTMRGEHSYVGSSDPREIAAVLDNLNDQHINRLTLGVSATFAQNLGLSHRLTLGYDYSEQDLSSVIAYGFPVRPEGSATTRTWQRGLGTLDYAATRVFAPSQEIRSTLSMGVQLVDDDIATSLATGDGFPSTGVTTPEAGEISQGIEQAGGTSTAGVFAQNVLGYADRFFLTLGLRADRYALRGESFLPIAPRVAGAWVVSDERFWPASLGVFRLRAAYGRSGAGAGPFEKADIPLGSPMPDTSGRVLKPEQVSEWEVGLEGAALGGRLAVGLTWYQQTTTDALVTVEDPSVPPQERVARRQNIGKVSNRGLELGIDAALLGTARWGLDLGLEVTTNHSKLLDLGGAVSYRDLNDWLIEGQPVPVARGRRVADPNAVNGPFTRERYVLDENGDPALVSLGPQLPTHFVASTLRMRMPWGVALSARGEYRGGNVRYVRPADAARTRPSPLCIPYYVDPDYVGPPLPDELKSDTPDLWRERCEPSFGSDYWFDADYFKLRSVYATIPVGFAFPESVEEATLTVSLANVWTWHREVPWWDLEILANDGANDDGLGTAERVPAPTTVTLGLRVRF